MARVRVCSQCRGKCTVVKDDGGTRYITDSDDEHALHYYDASCPACGGKGFVIEEAK